MQTLCQFLSEHQLFPESIWRDVADILKYWYVHSSFVAALTITTPLVAEINIKQKNYLSVLGTRCWHGSYWVEQYTIRVLLL